MEIDSHVLLCSSFAAFVLWAAIRIVNRGTKQGARFWVAVGFAAWLSLYVLSIGPACWLSSNAESGGVAVSVIYQPLMSACWRGDEVPGNVKPPDALYKYMMFGKNRVHGKISWRASHVRMNGSGWYQFSATDKDD